MDCQGHLDPQVKLEKEELKDHLDLEDIKECEELREKMVLMVEMVIQEFREPQDSLELRAEEEAEASLGPEEPLDLQAPQA